MVRIEQWRVVRDALGRLCLEGAVHGHPHKAEGTLVITSPIVDIDGRRIETRTGTEYELGAGREDDLTALGRVLREG